MKLKTLINTIIVASVLTVSTVVSAADYADVPDEHWATAVINEAAEAGIMYGRDDGTFGLGDTVKRSEFAAMLVKVFPLYHFFLMFNPTSGISQI